MADDIYGTVINAAKKYGVDPSTLLGIAGIESNMDPNAKNPNSSASGLMQFTDSTAKDYGLTDPFDATASADAGARMTAHNTSALTTSLGRSPTPGEVYLAHQQGLGGARTLLSHPDETAVDALTRVYGNADKARSAVLANGGTTDMSAKDFAAKWTAKGDASAKKYGYTITSSPYDLGSDAARHESAAKRNWWDPTASFPGALVPPNSMQRDYADFGAGSARQDQLRMRNPPKPGGFSLGGLFGGVLDAGKSALSTVGGKVNDAMAGAPGAVMSTMAQSLPVRSAVINGILKGAVESNRQHVAETDPNRGQTIQTDQHGSQTVGTRLNGSSRGLTVTGDDWFNKVRGL